MFKRFGLMILWFVCGFGFAASPPLLLRQPTLSTTRIAFAYGGEIWMVPRTGGQAHRLVIGADRLSGPIFSPDGKWIVYTGTYAGNTDIYVIPAQGGEPRRLTWYPGPDVAVGWIPNGKAVLFRSRRYSYSDPNQLFTVPVTGGFPKSLPLPMAQAGSFSPDATHLAYVPNFQWEPFWQHYRGGQTTPIWIADLADSSVVEIPRNNSNDRDPMWVGRRIYFLSDQAGPFTLFVYDPRTGKVRRLLPNKGLDITSAAAGPGGIVYSQFGQLHIFDFETGTAHTVPVSLTADMPQLRVHFKNVSKMIEYSGISPTGVRAVFGAYGEILTVPTHHGSIQNLTYSPGVEERDPAWSPNGKWIAYFADRNGEYNLYIRSQDGAGALRRVVLGAPDAFYYHLRWSPDSRKLVFSDQKLNLWYVDLSRKNPHAVKIDTDRYATPLHRFDAHWSPDSRWVAYTQLGPNFLHSIYLYSLENHSVYRITGSGSDCRYPVFDRSGKYLYFTSSTDTALTQGWLDMTGLAHPVRRHIYAILLPRNIPSPLAPRSGFEAPSSTSAARGDVSKNRKENAPVRPIRIDFAGIENRRVVLPVAPADYVGLEAGAQGVLYLLKGPLVVHSVFSRPKVSVLRFVLRTRKTTTLVARISHFILSANGKKMLYRKGKNWFIASTLPHAPDKATALKLSQLMVRVVPHESWAEMYRDTWRIQRAFFYNPNYDGLNISRAEREFSAYLPGITSRQGLTFLFREMLSYMAVGHMFVRGPGIPKKQTVQVGLLGADYRIEHGRYRITRIFPTQAWNPSLYAPLAQPGLKVHPGDYLLAVNGRPLLGSKNIYQAFENLADKTVILTVGPHPSDKDAHESIVKTIANEHALRNAAWIAHNIKLVNRLSHGRLGYVYLPNTAAGGFKNFNRYFFSQVNKQGVIIDERFNHGGLLSDYIIQYLNRRPMSIVISRYGKGYIEPPEALFGPKVMIINQFSGSGGDALPWYFKKLKLGPLVGVRTWGGLVGIGGYPTLMDGGSVTAPRWAVEGLHENFPVEDHGISPDIKVWQNPALMRKGHDPQLERAVKVALDLLKKHPAAKYSKPPYRNYHLKLPSTPGPGSGAGARPPSPAT